MKKSFTIIELLVVISVLGILVAIAIPRIIGMQQNSNLTKANNELNTLRAALESYRTFDTSHTFPPTTTTIGATYLSVATPKMVDVLYDPFGATSTTEYNYLCSSNGKYYVVWSVGIPGSLQPTAISNTGDISF